MYIEDTYSPQSTQFNLKSHAHPLARLASLLGFAFAMATAAAAQVAPPVGPYGFVANTTSSDPSTQGGAAMLGVINFDGVGGVSGPYTLELGSGGGKAAPETVTGTFTGTYSTNPDGTGEISILLDKANQNFTLAMVVDNNSRALQLALTGCSGPVCDLAGNVVSGVGAIEFSGAAHPVHLGFLNGSYGMQSTKSVPTPQTSLEVWSFDGAGNVSRSATYVEPGLTVQNEVRHGTYTINPNGTGTVTLAPLPGLQNSQTYVFVITNGHSGLLALQTNRAGDGVLYLTGQHQ